MKSSRGFKFKVNLSLYVKILLKIFWLRFFFADFGGYLNENWLWAKKKFKLLLEEGNYAGTGTISRGTSRQRACPAHSRFLPSEHSAGLFACGETGAKLRKNKLQDFQKMELLELYNVKCTLPLKNKQITKHKLMLYSSIVLIMTKLYLRMRLFFSFFCAFLPSSWLSRTTIRITTIRVKQLIMLTWKLTVLTSSTIKESQSYPSTLGWALLAQSKSLGSSCFSSYCPEKAEVNWARSTVQCIN